MKLISHKIFLKHDFEGHPERAERIKKALSTFDYEDAVDGEKYLSKVHSSKYIHKVKESSARAGKGVRFLDAGETYACKDTYKAACYAVGAAVQSAEYALNKKNAFALVRPPGHHAHPDWTNGFCVFNNIAIAAKYLIEKNQKVLIIDIDMHRGDGTSEVVQKDKSGKLYYFSINQYGIFPGMAIDEGDIKNIYVEPTMTEDGYIDLLNKELPPLINKFKPSVIAISAGFDGFLTDKESHAHTLGCGMTLTKKSIYALKKIINGTPYFAVLEGGYNPESVVDGVGAFLSSSGNSGKLPAVKSAVKKAPVKKKPSKKKVAAKPKKKPIKKKPKKAVAKKVKKKPDKKKSVKKTKPKKKAKVKPKNKVKAKKKTVKKKTVKKKAKAKSKAKKK